MTIIVVKTCDGDVYFQSNRQASKGRAADMAVDQIMNGDLARYSEEDRTIVREAQAKGYTALWTALQSVGALRVAEVNS